MGKEGRFVEEIVDGFADGMVGALTTDAAMLLAIGTSVGFLVAARRRNRALRRRHTPGAGCALAAVTIATAALVGPLGRVGDAPRWIAVLALLGALLIGRSHAVLPWLLPHDWRGH